MAIFPLIETEPLVQVNDKTRLSAVKSFISKDSSAITAVEISPDDGEDFLDISGTTPLNAKNWYLDWCYADAGDKTVTLRITTADESVEFTKTISIISEEDDKLWSSDSDLQVMEPDILSWVRVGRSSFLDTHRTSQKRILEWLDNIKVWDKNGKPFTKDDIDVVMAAEDLKRISVYWALELIFGGLSNKPDDTFAKKEASYKKSRKELQADRSRIRVDYNKDGTVQDGEQFQIKTMRLTR